MKIPANNQVFEIFQGPLLLTWINFNPSMDEYIIISIIKRGMKHLIQSQTSMVQMEKMEWIRNYIPQLGKWLHIHAGFKSKPC